MPGDRRGSRARPKPLWCRDCGIMPYPPSNCPRGRCHAGRPPERRAADAEGADRFVAAFAALDEAPAIRAALIGLLWYGVIDEVECECPDEPGPYCEAMRALGFGDHWDPDEFSRLALDLYHAKPLGPSVFFGCPACGAGPRRVTRWRAGDGGDLVYSCRCGATFGAGDGAPW